MKFPKFVKRPEDLLPRDEKRLGLTRKVSLNFMLIGSMLFRPVASEAQAAPASDQQSKIEPKQIETKQKLVRVGKRLKEFISVLDPGRFFQHRSHSSHSSHSSHRSHSSHTSHYSGSPPPPPPPAPPPPPPPPPRQPPTIAPPVESAVSLTAKVTGLNVIFEIVENRNTPRHNMHRWDFGDGSIRRQRHAVSHTFIRTYSNPGIYEVTLELMLGDTAVAKATATLELTGR